MTDSNKTGKEIQGREEDGEKGEGSDGGKTNTKRQKLSVLSVLSSLQTLLSIQSSELYLQCLRILQWYEPSIRPYDKCLTRRICFP